MAWWDDLDFLDEDVGGAFDMGGFDIGNVDLSGAFDLEGLNLGDIGVGSFDLGGFNLGDLDLSGAFDLGGLDLGDIGVGAFDLGGLDLGQVNLENLGMADVDLGNVDFGLPSLENIGLGAEDLGTVDFGGLGRENIGMLPEDLGTVDFGDLGIQENIGLRPEDLGNVDFGGMSQDVKEDITQAFGGDAEAQEGGFYGTTDTAYYDPRTNLTTLYDESGQLRDFVTHEGGAADVGGGHVSDAEAQEGGFYGNTPNATYDPKTNTTTLRDSQGNVTKTIYHKDDVGITKDDLTKRDDTKKDDKSILDELKKLLGGEKNNTALMTALLGGLLGLLNRPKGTGAPGYKGGIPKYMATRGKPGEGTRFVQQAAGGGLMGLAAGGAARPARYLRGGTDGMADKIKTDIDGKQPARLSHGEFVIPADVVSHLGNGNSDAGADVLYDMMAKVRKARTGTPKQGKQINPRKYTPA